MGGRGRRRLRPKRPAEKDISHPDEDVQDKTSPSKRDSSQASTSNVDLHKQQVQAEVHAPENVLDVREKPVKAITVESSNEEDIQDVQEIMDSTDDVASVSDETELKNLPFPDIDGNVTDSDGPKKGTRKKNIVSYNFTEEEESEISEWYQSHPCLYNKRNRDFRKTSMKIRLIQEKAETFDPPCSCKFQF